MAAAVFTGCASLAEYRDDPPKTADVVRNVRCELLDAIRSDPVANDWLLTEKKKGWLVKLSFDLSVDQNGEISTGDNVWVFPMNKGATFLLTLGAGVTGTGNRRENIEFDHALKDLDGDKKLDCSDPQGGRFSQLSGNLGIVDLIDRASLSRVVSTDTGALSKLTYTIEFIVKKTANLAPKFNLIPIGKEKTYTGSPRWNGTRTDTQKLTITFTPNPPDKDEDICPVVPDPTDGWPDTNLADLRRKCPMPVYQVNVRPSCEILRFENLCKARDDCALITIKVDDEDQLRCAPACNMLAGEKECTRRKKDCTWTPKNRSCSDKDPARTTAARSRARGRAAVSDPGKPLYVPSIGTTGTGGVSQAGKDALDRAAGRSVLDNIDAQLSRQRQ